MQKKFLYDYSQEELAGWNEKFLQPMMKKARRGVLFFNNHVRAHAVTNGMALQKVLEEQA